MNNETVKKENFFSKPWVKSLSSIIIIFGLLAGLIYWLSVKDTVFIENSYLNAPIANMSSSVPGILNGIYVKTGDKVITGQELALVGSEIIYARNDGIISDAPKVTGTYFSSGQNVVSVVAYKQMQVVGTIDETGGLDRIKAGQSATFIVDTFPGKVYEGIVDKVSVTSSDTGVIFSISDKRPVKKFSVYLNFDVNKYPELKSGMSAKITVSTRK